MTSNSMLGSLFQRDYVRKGDLYYQKGNLGKAAEMYLKAKRYQQAARIFEESGEVDRAVAVYRDNGLPLLAAELLAAHGQEKEAIACYEEAGAYRQAAEQCVRLQQFVRAGRLFERAGMYQQAAECFAKVGEVEQSLRAWELEAAQLKKELGDQRDHGLEQRIRRLDLHRAELLINLGRALEAAQLLMQHGMPVRAAPLFEKARRFAEAAAAYLAAGRPQEALAAIEQANDAQDGLRAEVYQRAGRFAEAGEVLERLGHREEAASAFQNAEEWARAAFLLEEADQPERAAELFLRVELWRDAGRCFALAERHNEAVEVFARGGDAEAAANAFLAAGNHFAAGEHYLEVGFGEPALLAFENVPEASEHYVQASLLLLPLLLEAERSADAEARLRVVEEAGDAAASLVERLYWRGRVEEAAGRFGDAEGTYLLVLGERQGYRDVDERLQDVRGKLEEPVEELFVDTSPVTFDSKQFEIGTSSFLPPMDVPASAVEAGMVEPAADFPGVVPRPSMAHSLSDTGLPFDIEKRVEPWWDGAEFFHAVDRRHHRAILLVSFPLAEVGFHSQGFNQAMREVVALNHPVILKLFEVITASDKVLLLYEHFAGQPLASVLTRQRVPPMAGLNLLVQLCEALTTAHKLGVTHQWLSPRTVLLDPKARAKLVGIGMREILAERDHTSRAYLSPEVRSKQMVGPAADVFSLGLLAVELLQALLPANWSEQTKLNPTTVTWPDEVVEAVPSVVREMLVRCLAREPVERPSTEELKRAFSSIGLLPGQILANRYEILGELGRGGMSRVYRARDRELEDEVAIKTMLTPALGRSDDEERLLREVQICRKITHPNVVRVHDFGRFPGGIFVIMELLDGPGLDEVIKREAPLPLARVKKLLTEIAAALGEAHRLKIIHRDLKPGNVMLTDGRVKVMDFGIARMGDGAGSQLTRTGEVIGSPMYMAPEQIQGQPLSGTCDLYALGVIAYTLISGHEPFKGDTTTAVVLRHLHEPPRDIRDFRPDLAPEWRTLLDSLLAKNPKERCQSADELLEILARLPE